ncbi:MAG: DUF4270 domain-containing protein [Bacteroidales bacterium]|nr:DUF4270 domain-containing protein [Candidatus Physcousia equi]
MNRLRAAFAAIAGIFLTSACTDDTGTMGLYEANDGVSTFETTYDAHSRSVTMGSIIADNTNAYLGNVVDPETGTNIKAECAVQFHCFENYTMPKKELMVGKYDMKDGKYANIEYGVPTCDSIEVRIYLNSYYGMGNTPMKLEVYELDPDNIMKENTVYRTDVDLTQYLKQPAVPIATKVFTPIDYSISDAERENESYTDNIRIILPKEIGQRIINKYYASPSSFSDSFNFIHEVFPGLFFRIKGGEGTMLKTFVSALNIYYNYCDAYYRDVVYQGVSRFSATPEVIQSTNFVNTGVNDLANDYFEDGTMRDFTYLKSPAGICTELTLPVDEIFASHPDDSISLAQITLTRLNKEGHDAYQLPATQEILMVRKSEMESFFNKHAVSNGRTSFTASLNTGYNAFIFNNISRLISYCKNEKANGARKRGITEEVWAKENPDWNKVLLIPVVTSSNSSGVQTSVSHNMQLTSTRLVGARLPIKINVIYTHYSE